MAKLTILAGPARDWLYNLGQEDILGRSSENSIPLKDTKSSRRNTRIYCQDNEYFVEDMGSRNGTLVNGKKLQGKHKLVENDQVRVGETSLQFTMEAPVKIETEEETSVEAKLPPKPIKPEAAVKVSDKRRLAQGKKIPRPRTRLKSHRAPKQVLPTIVRPVK